MKRSTAIRHLTEMAETASDGLRLRDSDIGWPLEELWVTGELLGFADPVELGSVVLVLDVPASELPLLARHPTGEWVGHQLRLGKRPLLWSYRPLTSPVWSYENRRVARFWSAAAGLDTATIDALSSRRLDALAVIEPSPAELAEQLCEELARSRHHLKTIVENYWDRGWRQEHKGYDKSPEDHLWRAATAVTEISDALDSLDSQPPTG